MSNALGVERPIIRYFGGKWILAPWIISHFPTHRVYVEPFGGAASVLMRKARCYAEIYNDLDGEIVNLFRVLQDRYDSKRLERLLRFTPFARDEFDLAYLPTNDRIESARRLIIRCFMGFGSDGHNIENGKTGFRADSNKSGSTPAHDWVNYPDQIKRFYERLSAVVIESRDALEVMAQHDSPSTLHFIDPPYVQETRGSKHFYKFEMSDEAHRRLVEFVASLKGMVILCGYENKIYNRLGWRKIKREAHADGARDRVEVLWLNPQVASQQKQIEMFDAMDEG